MGHADVFGLGASLLELICGYRWHSRDESATEQMLRLKMKTLKLNRFSALVEAVRGLFEESPTTDSKDKHHRTHMNACLISYLLTTDDNIVRLRRSAHDIIAFITIILPQLSGGNHKSILDQVVQLVGILDHDYEGNTDEERHERRYSYELPDALREYLGIRHTVKGEDREVAIPNLVTQPVFKMLQRQHSNDPDAEEILNVAEKDHAESSRRTTAALAKSIRQVRQPNPFADMFGSRSSAPCPKRRRVERMPTLQFGSSQASSASTPRKAPGTPDKKQDGIPLKLGF